MNPANLGFVKHFDEAVYLCKGNMTFLSDQVDVWHPERIECMNKPLVEDNDVGFVYCDAEIVDENLKSLGCTIFVTRKNARLYPHVTHGTRSFRINVSSSAASKERLSLS
jgi:hypothetical protein